MSNSKLTGTGLGAVAGGVITVLFEIAALRHNSAPGTVVAAVFLSGVFLGALLGSIIGKEDRIVGTEDRLTLAVTVEKDRGEVSSPEDTAPTT